jgi:hypothetical protein
LLFLKENMVYSGWVKGDLFWCTSCLGKNYITRRFIRSKLVMSDTLGAKLRFYCLICIFFFDDNNKGILIFLLLLRLNYFSSGIDCSSHLRCYVGRIDCDPYLFYKSQ